jgi:hypothetical protein
MVNVKLPPPKWTGFAPKRADSGSESLAFTMFAAEIASDSRQIDAPRLKRSAQKSGKKWQSIPRPVPTGINWG